MKAIIVVPSVRLYRLLDHLAEVLPSRQNVVQRNALGLPSISVDPILWVPIL